MNRLTTSVSGLQVGINKRSIDQRDRGHCVPNLLAIAKCILAISYNKYRYHLNLKLFHIFVLQLFHTIWHHQIRKRVFNTLVGSGGWAGGRVVLVSAIVLFWPVHTAYRFIPGGGGGGGGGGRLWRIQWGVRRFVLDINMSEVKTGGGDQNT